MGNFIRITITRVVGLIRGITRDLQAIWATFIRIQASRNVFPTSGTLLAFSMFFVGLLGSP